LLSLGHIHVFTVAEWGDCQAQTSFLVTLQGMHKAMWSAYELGSNAMEYVLQHNGNDVLRTHLLTELLDDPFCPPSSKWKRPSRIPYVS
jgi:hypothetical protein